MTSTLAGKRAALLGGGQRSLGELFPGLEQDLAQAGAVALRAGLDVRVEMSGYDRSRSVIWAGSTTRCRAR